MNKARNLELQRTVCIVSLALLSACGQASPARPTLTVTTAPIQSPTSTRTPIPTNTLTPEPTPTEEIKQFNRCPAEKFRDCHIAPEDLRAYADWIKKQLPNLNLPEPDRKKVVAFSNGVKDTAFWYSTLHFEDIDIVDRPFSTGNTFGYTEGVAVTSEGATYPETYAVSTIVFSIPGKPREVKVIPVLLQRPINWQESDFIAYLNRWSTKGAFLLAVIDSKHIVNPFAGMNEANFPDSDARVNKFYETLDPTYIDGIIFEAFIAK